jgi:hypothetical protein
VLQFEVKTAKQLRKISVDIRAEVPLKFNCSILIQIACVRRTIAAAEFYADTGPYARVLSIYERRDRRPRQVDRVSGGRRKSLGFVYRALTLPEERPARVLVALRAPKRAAALLAIAEGELAGL